MSRVSAEAIHRNWDRNLKTFTVTEDHLKLLRRAGVRWSDVEFGAPEIDDKRPYGNSGVLADVLEILQPDLYGQHNDSDSLADYIDEHEEELTRLHVGTAFALQIALCTGEFKPGEYRRKGYDAWELVAAGEGQ